MPLIHYSAGVFSEIGLAAVVTPLTAVLDFFNLRRIRGRFRRSVVCKHERKEICVHRYIDCLLTRSFSQLECEDQWCVNMNERRYRLTYCSRRLATGRDLSLAGVTTFLLVVPSCAVDVPSCALDVTISAV